MSKTIRGVLALMLLLSASNLLALDVPPAPRQWVTDGAGVLSSPDLQQLNDKLRQFEQRRGAQFIIYLFPSLENESLEDFTIRAADTWKVGNKKYDNGLILFVFVQERKIRVEVGYGLEGTVTDAVSSRVIRDDMAPRFRNGDYAGGLDAAVNSLVARIEGNEAAVPVSQPTGQVSVNDIWPLLVILFIFVFFVLPLLRRGGCGGCGGCLPLPFPMSGVTYGGGGHGSFGGGGGGFGGFSGGGGGFGGGGASGGW